MTFTPMSPGLAVWDLETCAHQDHQGNPPHLDQHVTRLTIAPAFDGLIGIHDEHATPHLASHGIRLRPPARLEAIRHQDLAVGFRPYKDGGLKTGQSDPERAADVAMHQGQRRQQVAFPCETLQDFEAGLTVVYIVCIIGA
jgi:hypothetical protein